MELKGQEKGPRKRVAAGPKVYSLQRLGLDNIEFNKAAVGSNGAVEEEYAVKESLVVF